MVETKQKREDCRHLVGPAPEPTFSGAVPSAQLVVDKNKSGFKGWDADSNHEAVTQVEGGVGQGGSKKEEGEDAGIKFPSNLTVFREARWGDMSGQEQPVHPVTVLALRQQCSRSTLPPGGWGGGGGGRAGESKRGKRQEAVPTMVFPNQVLAV